MNPSLTVREAKVEYIKPKDKIGSLTTVDHQRMADIAPGMMTPNTSNIRHVDHEEKQVLVIEIF
jgi:hypothetical protein